MRRVANARWSQHVQRILESAPPLTEEQVKAIATVLRQVGHSKDGGARDAS
jgi:hypothetical protein